MQDISGYGLKALLVAKDTFPAGFEITQFADDTDPFDIPSIQIADKAMGMNGDLVVWNVASPIELSIAVIPDSEDDRNLSILFEANRVGRGKRAVLDEIILTAIYPDRLPLVFNSGKMTDGMPGTSAASAGRKKTKVYSFAFENRIGF